MTDLMNREIVLGVTGGIAAYKAVDLVSRLKKRGANVHVIMTKHATEFVTPLTFETMSGNPVVTDTFARPEKWDVAHVSLAKRAELMLIAPATANILAKLAHGLADDMLSTTALATKAPILLAPAMNVGMWSAEATQENLQTLRNRGVHTVGPDSGKLACGDTGTGRMSEPQEIADAAAAILLQQRDLTGLKVLVTAGGTRERLDPVRYLGNDSSGKMGFALAEAARDRGAEVTVVKGHVEVPIPAGVTVVPVESTLDLYEAMLRLAPEADIVIQAAAPADYRFETTYDQKLKKADGEPMTLRLVENPDVAAAVGAQKRPGQTLVGFAAETQHLLENARKKMEKKQLDLLVANDVTQAGAGFNVDTNIATLLTAAGENVRPLQTKRALAEDILDAVLQLRGQA